MVLFSLNAGLAVSLLGALSSYPSGAISAALPQGESSPFESDSANNTWYHLQSFGVNQKYHKSTPSFVSFTGNDGYLTESKSDAARFWIWGGQLGVDDKFVHLDFSNGYAVVKLDERPSEEDYGFFHGEDGWLHVQGGGISYGEGSQAVFCQSDDGSIFLQGHGKPPFACQDIGLAPRQRAGPAPRSLPPRPGKAGAQRSPSPIPTATSTVVPRSVPEWWKRQVGGGRGGGGGGRGGGGGGRGGGGGGRGGGGGGRGGGGGGRGGGGGGRGGGGFGGGGFGGGRGRPGTGVGPVQPNPSSDNDAVVVVKRSFEFDGDGEIVE
ncbi:hypothetical protein FOPE_07550 [Fonsecaea pedrosoi]|nr:hypothetical protein FOPE_07550 [Fonsecaea pedrosoi]